MIKEVMLTGATQPGLNIVASGMYHVSNPGLVLTSTARCSHVRLSHSHYALRPFGSPYPWSFSLGSNQSDYLDDVRIAHPFLPPGEKVSTFLEGLVGSDEQKQLFAQGFQNVSELAQETCCQGELYGFALPFSQSESNAATQTELQSSLRYYVAMSGKLNQTDDIWYTACPYTDIPVEPRSNSNFPASLMPSGAMRLGGGGYAALGGALAAIAWLF